MIRLGYACINTVCPSPNRTTRLSGATPERLLELSRANLAALEGILRWNQAHAIQLFRLSSDIIPFGSHPVNTLEWWRILRPELERVAEIIRLGSMRVSMHPGQYTVLNSPRSEVLANSAAELAYSARLLDALTADLNHKIVLHLGGTYGDRPASMARFVANHAALPESVTRRLVLENDEKQYTLADALALSAQTGAPVVFDVFHHTWNPSLAELPLRALIERASATWQAGDGRPKLHYSDPWPGKARGAHSQSVDISAFARFYESIRGLDLDIMLEVKDKEQSVLALYERFPKLLATAAGG